MSRTTIIATGDSFITRRLPENGYEGFEPLRKIISRYDVRFNNLEITTHYQEGVPAAFSGGTWAMAEPEILDDLKRFGFNVFNTAKFQGKRTASSFTFLGILFMLRFTQ